MLSCSKNGLALLILQKIFCPCLVVNKVVTFFDSQKSLHCFALLCCAPLSVALHGSALRCFASLHSALLCIALLCIVLLCIASLCFDLQCLALPCLAWLCIALQCFAMLCFALRCSRSLRPAFGGLLLLGFHGFGFGFGLPWLWLWLALALLVALALALACLGFGFGSAWGGFAWLCFALKDSEQRKRSSVAKMISKFTGYRLCRDLSSPRCFD